MPGIIITPGTTNPPLTPVQIVVGYPFPKVPVQTIRKWRQFNPRWVGGLEPVLVPLPVIYSYVDFITGDITVGVDVETFDSSKPNFTTAGVRYVADALYLKTAQDAGGKTYSAVGTPPYTAGGGSIEVGLVEAEYGGDFAMPSNHFRVLLEFALTVTGTGDGATYTTTLADGHPDAITTLTGTIWLIVPYPVDPASNGYINQEIDTEKYVTVSLRRNGVLFERIYLAIPINGEVSFTLVPLSPGASLAIPEVDSELTWSDTLYGPTAATPAGGVPGIPYSGYVRENWASEGEVTLS